MKGQGSLGSPPRQVVYLSVSMVPQWVTASRFLAANREFEVKPTTFYLLILFFNIYVTGIDPCYIFFTSPLYSSYFIYIYIYIYIYNMRVYLCLGVREILFIGCCCVLRNEVKDFLTAFAKISLIFVEFLDPSRLATNPRTLELLTPLREEGSFV